MSIAYQPFDARLMQNGILSGYRLAQEGDQFGQQQALQRDVLNERIRQAKEESDRNLDERKADAEFYRQLAAQSSGGIGVAGVQGPVGPRPPSANEPASFTGTFGSAPQAPDGQPQAAPMMGPVPHDPLQGINPALASRLSNHARGVLGQLVENRAKMLQDRQDAQVAIDNMKDTGVLAAVPKDVWDKWESVAPDLTAAVPTDRVPWYVRERRQYDGEAARVEQIVSLSHGPDGSFDAQKFQELNRQDAQTIHHLYLASEGSKFAEQRATAAIQAKSAEDRLKKDAGAAALKRIRSGVSQKEGTFESDFATAREADLAHQVEVNATGRQPDKYVATRAANLEQDAKDDYERARHAYESLNVSGTDKHGLTPPTDKEFKAWQVYNSGRRTGKADDASAVAKVQAWYRLQQSSDAIRRAREKRDTLLSGNTQPDQSAPQDPAALDVDAEIDNLIHRGITDPATIKAELAKKGIHQ